MKNLNTIVKYHGCGIGYLDGTRELVKRSCSKPTFNPFWKNPEHTSNRVAKSTRVQLKRKPAADRLYIRKYVKKYILNHGEAMQVLNYIGNFSSSDTDTDSDTDSGYYSDNSLPETNYHKISNLTGKNLSIDIKPDPEDVEQKPDTDPNNEPDNEQNPELKTNKQTPDNK